jgi:membrane fusion protein, copper/silver efflux system
MSSRTRRAFVALALVAAALAGLLALTGCRSEGPAAEEVWYCPMHPDYVADRPGSCPICHMDLVKREAAEKPTLWVCPMHPEIVRHEPGQCPICGMDLVGRSDGAAAAPTGERKVLFYRNPMDPAVTSPVPAKDEMGMDYVPVYANEAAGAAPGGFAAVDLDAEGRRMSGVVVAEARAGTLARVVRTVGSVVADERRARRLEARFSGWVEVLAADFVGRSMRAGETVAEIYSPELVAAQQEYLLAREKGQSFIASSIPEVRRGGQDLVEAARRRLEIFGLPEEFLADLEREGRPRRRVPLAAPISGYVVSKGVIQGQQVLPGQEIVTLSDLSSIWVEASVYEADAAKVRPGQTARLSLSYEPDVVREGKVAYIFPDLDPATRTLRVRFDVANRDLSWRPGMYTDVVLDLGEVAGILVPDTAVLDTGERQIAFVETAPGRFEPRELAVALRREGQAVVASGLAAGDRVAVKANFLLDSESRLRAAISASARELAAGAPKPAGSEGPR